MFQVYEHVINPEKLRVRIDEGEKRFRAEHRRIVVDKRAHFSTAALQRYVWHDDETRTRTWAVWSGSLADALTAAGIPWTIERAAPLAQSADKTQQADKKEQFEAVKRWFEDDWMRMDPKLRTSIIEGISVFLSLFDDNPRVKYTFCPPKEAYDPAQNPDGKHGTPLPPLADLIEQGKVIALNFPIATNPGLARALGTMLKQDFQRAVLNRIHRFETDPSRSQRPVLFVCDEYQAFATSGENEPSGDEKFFALARQARCIPLVATQSISSLRSTLSGEAWRTLLQALRTKIFLTISDDFTAQIASELCGKVERLKAGYSITEAGQDARISILTGRPRPTRPP